MVDIKREDLTLSDWTKGISADEFAGGSYFYSDNIQSGYSTKGFKLGPKVETYSLNERTQGYPVAVYPCEGSMLSSSQTFIAFTKDRTLEMGGTLNGSTKGEGGDAGGGAIWQEGTVVDWTGGFVYGDYALIFTETTIKKIDYKNTYNIDYGQTITNPRFENSASGWTVGSGWTLTDDGMEHETGETGTLEVTAPCYADGYGRFAIKITNCTAGNVVVHQSKTNTDAITTEAGRNGWFVGIANGMVLEENNTITVTPSSDFDGTVEAVNFNVYNSLSSSTISGLTDANKHKAIERGGDIYIASGNTIDILSTISWTITDSKEICRKDEEIIAITQQGDSLIIRATDGTDSRQYYWNGVDSVASECIRWQGQVIKAVTGTEIISYVLAGTGAKTARNAYRLYSVSGYQRSLIASNAYKTQSASWNLEHYHSSKKFAFNDVQGSESMCVCLDNLYVPGCDGIYKFGQVIPGLGNSWTRPIKYVNGADRLFLIGDGGVPMFTYRLNQRQYYAQIREDQYADSGYLVTDSLYWDKLGTRKAIEKLKLGYKSLPSTAGNIKLYVIVDDDYFWRFDVTNVTNRPKIGDVYTVATNTNAEVININKASTTSGEITFRTISNGGSLDRANRYLDKVSGNGDASIDTNNNYDNMCLIKTIETEQQCFGADLIFGKDFVNNYMPFWHKIQLVIEINKTDIPRNSDRTAEIYELSMTSDITDITL